MDLPRLQAQFSRYLQSLLALGYLDRSEFRTFYVTGISTRGLASEFFSLFYNNANNTLQMMEQAMAAPETNFPIVVALADNLLASAGSIGALRIKSLIRYIRVYAEIAHKQGCLRYLKMLGFEFKALAYSFNIIIELETSIVQRGGSVPFDW